MNSLVHIKNYFKRSTVKVKLQSLKWTIPRVWSNFFTQKQNKLTATVTLLVKHDNQGCSVVYMVYALSFLNYFKKLCISPISIAYTPWFSYDYTTDDNKYSSDLQELTIPCNSWQLSLLGSRTYLRNYWTEMLEM